MTEERCEVQNCLRPGYICPVYAQCFCWQHLQYSDCKACHHLLAARSFEHRLGRLKDIGLDVLLCGFLVLLLPRDESKITIQLPITLLIGGSLILWIGFLIGSDA
jgi:hypothetical protein